VAKLPRCISRLKQSPREWYYRLVEYLGHCGIVVTAWVPYVIIHVSQTIFLVIYVGVIMQFRDNGEIQMNMKFLCKAEFKLNVMGELTCLLWIQKNCTQDEIIQMPMSFLDGVLIHFPSVYCKPVLTTIGSNHTLQAAEVDEQGAD